MPNQRIFIGIAIASLAAGGIFSAPVRAESNDAGPIANAHISLDAATVTAEKHVHGKAARAEYEKQKDGKWVFDVEVVAANGVFDVKIDPGNGSVIASTKDKADSDDHGDEID